MTACGTIHEAFSDAGRTEAPITSEPLNVQFVRPVNMVDFRLDRGPKNSIVRIGEIATINLLAAALAWLNTLYTTNPLNTLPETVLARTIQIK